MSVRTLLTALIAVAPGVLAARQPDVPPPFAARPLAIGVSWYPEQWPEAQWDADLAAMRRANLSVVRIGEFAWARMEPADGSYDFGWLDRAIAAAARHGIRVVIGTPTAAPPVWLTEAHPDTLRVDADGTIEGHGSRRQFSFSSVTYRSYAARIAAALATRYGNEPNVVGWQIDNEIGVPSFDRETKALWARWLAVRYPSIGALNHRWSTQYWSQHYDRFEQVPLKASGPQNPALLLDFRRFASDTWADYIGNQAKVIRERADPRQFVTTNSTAWNNNFDQYRVHRDLTLAAWDEYVPDGRPDWESLALHHAVVRGYLNRNFWVMETQSGNVDWAPVNRSLDPGQTRELAWQAVAHGADAILYWQWRSAPGGQEQYHGTLVGPAGDPMPILPEISRTATEMAAARRFLARTIAAPAQVAIIYSQESRWATEQQRHAKDYDPVQILKDWYRPLAAARVQVDVVSPTADLSRYRLVLAPNLNVMDKATASRLRDYAHRGGRLVLGPRSGMKDGDNALWPQRRPGPLVDLIGGRVMGYYPLDATVEITGEGAGGAARVWAEALEGDQQTEVLARYAPSAPWLGGRPAMLRALAGKGSVYYLGAMLDGAGQAKFTSRLLSEAGVATPWKTLLPGVEVATRAGPEGHVQIFINHRDDAAALVLPPRYRLVLGKLDQGQLAPHDVVVAIAIPSKTGAMH